MLTRVLRPALLIVLLAAAVPAHATASPGTGPTAAVAIGDSYISGEAGRWQGNSLNSSPGNDGTDRACTGGPPCTVDKTRVYVGGTQSGCHRSDVSEILTAKLPVAERINISCSGGVTKNVFRAASGGVGQNGEPPQADQLLPIAKAKDVKLIEVSIGGNDLGFASIVGACLQAYVSKGTPCNQTQQPKLDAAKPKAIADVEKAIDEIRAVMTDAGYQHSDYRLVLQTYPSVIPRATESRYTENDPNRPNVCPFYDADLTWGRDSASKQIGGVVKTAATARGVEILDLADAFQGHEFCAKTAELADPLHPPSPTTSEWGRFLGGSAIQQGELQEVFHPNAYGQAAFATCVGEAFDRPPGEFTCTSSAGRTPQAMTLVQTATFPAAPQAPATAGAAVRRLGLGVLKRSRRSGRTCVTFSVRAVGKPVKAARVRLAASHGATAANGHVVLCARLARRATAVAKRTGFTTSPVRRVARARR